MGVLMMTALLSAVQIRASDFGNSHLEKPLGLAAEAEQSAPKMVGHRCGCGHKLGIH